MAKFSASYSFADMRIYPCDTGVLRSLFGGHHGPRQGSLGDICISWSRNASQRDDGKPLLYEYFKFDDGHDTQILNGRFSQLAKQAAHGFK